MPGAISLGAPHTVDVIVKSWASEATKKKFDGVLDALDQKSIETSGRSFVELDLETQYAVYESFDAEKIAASPKMPPMPWSVALGAYPRLKELLLTAFYLSELVQLKF